MYHGLLSISFKDGRHFKTLAACNSQWRTKASTGVRQVWGGGTRESQEVSLARKTWCQRGAAATNGGPCLRKGAIQWLQERGAKIDALNGALRRTGDEEWVDLASPSGRVNILLIGSCEIISVFLYYFFGVVYHRWQSHFFFFYSFFSW